MHNFSQLARFVSLIVEKEGKDPLKYVATGPAGMPRSSAVSGLGFYKADPKRKDIDIHGKGVIDSPPPSVNHTKRLINLALTVVYAAPESNRALKIILMNLMENYRKFKSFKQEWEAKERAPESPDHRGWDEIQADINQVYSEIQESTPILNDKISKIFVQSGKKFLKIIQDLLISKGKDVKTLNDIKQMYSPSEEGMEYLANITSSETFTPYDRFSLFYLKEMENAESRGISSLYLSPVWILITMYKNVVDTVASKGLDASPEKLIDYILSHAERSSGITVKAADTKLAAKHPDLARISRMIKAGQLHNAIKIAKASNIDERIKTAIENKLNELGSGNTSEGDVLRFIHSL